MPRVDDQFEIESNVLIELIGPDGELKDRIEVHNLMTTVGKQAAIDQLLAEPSKAKPSHMAIGEGEKAPEATDTKLQKELGRNALASKTRKENVLTMVAEWGPGDGTGPITEAGVFNAGASGDMYNRVVFPVINKAAGDELKITWTIEGK